MRRVGAVVIRERGAASPSVKLLLAYLEKRGFPYAPRVVHDPADREDSDALTFIQGESPHPYAWSDEGIALVGEMLRDLHRATADFSSPAEAVWRPWFGRLLPGTDPVIGHCDAAPWNVIANDARPLAFVDWENAGPVDRRWELAQAAWLNAHLHDDDVAARFGLPDPDRRAKQVRYFLDGYGVSAAERKGFVDAMAEFAIYSARQDAIDGGVTPDSVDPTPGTGSSGGAPLPAQHVLWGITWRARSAAWILQNRALLERALA